MSGTPRKNGENLEVAFRPIRDQRDIPQLKRLHDANFPLVYERRYYDWLLTSNCTSVMAVVPKFGPCATGEDDIDEERRAGWQQGELADTLNSERIIGFIVGRTKQVRKTVEGVSLFGSPNTVVAYISTFAVHPEYRHHGIGGDLLEQLLLRFQSLGSVEVKGGWLSPKVTRFRPLCDEVYLHCLESNHLALEFYRRRGFVIVDVLRDYYSFGGTTHSAVVLRALLEGCSSKKDKVPDDPWKRRPGDFLEDGEDLNFDTGRPSQESRVSVLMRFACLAVGIVLVTVGVITSS